MMQKMPNVIKKEGMRLKINKIQDEFDNTCHARTNRKQLRMFTGISVYLGRDVFQTRSDF